MIVVDDHLALARLEHRLNVLQAETLGAAIHHGVGIRLAGPNGGGPLEEAARRAGVDCQVVGEPRRA